ncbi:MAG: trypsin-like serine protease [Alsobacter sp.]
MEISGRVARLRLGRAKHGDDGGADGFGSMRQGDRTAVRTRLARLQCAVALAALVAGPSPAGAIVQGQDNPALSRQAVMVLGSRGGFCSGVVLAPTIVLTAGHCVTGASDYRVHYKAPGGEPVLLEPAAIAVHPGFVTGATKQHKKSVDLGLVRLRTPLPAAFTPAALGDAAPRAGERLTVGGYGLGRDGQAATGGTFRSADLSVIEPYGQSTVLVWLTDPATGRSRNGSGACGGDSGGPIFGPDGRVVAVTAFAEGAGASRCGALTQGVLVGPQRDWIDRVVAGWR